MKTYNSRQQDKALHQPPRESKPPTPDEWRELNLENSELRELLISTCHDSKKAIRRNPKLAAWWRENAPIPCSG